MYKIHSQARRISEFPELCGLLLGRWAEWLATAFCLLAVLGASVVYWVLMSNFFFNTVNFIHDHVTDHDNFTNASTGVFCPKDEAPHQLDDDYDEAMNTGNSASPPSTFSDNALLDAHDERTGCSVRLQFLQTTKGSDT